MPVVYITDYRKKKQGNSENLNELSIPTTEEYRKEILEKNLLDPIYLNSERQRYELAISKLDFSNKDMQEENDPEFLEFIEENLRVIEKYQHRIKIRDEMLGQSGSIYL